MKIRSFWILVVFLPAILLSSCSPTPSDNVIQTAIAKTQALLPSKTIEPSETSEPKTPTPKVDGERIKLINEVIELLDSQNYSEAYEKLRFVGALGEKYANDKEIQELRSFALDMALIVDNRGGLYDDSFGRNSPNYKGVYSQKISNAVLEQISQESWERRYEETQKRLATVIAEYNKPEPYVGMTADDVRNSRWGEPQDIRRTTYKDSISEQWIYSDYRYIYFENGIVTAIQE